MSDKVFESAEAIVPQEILDSSSPISVVRALVRV
jgi:hypothetical protein